MEKSKSTKSTTAFENAKQSLVVRPLSLNTQAFIYSGYTDLKNLILFVGSKPTIDENGDLWFKKTKVVANSVILRDAYGKLTEQLTFEQAAGKYEIVASSDFKPEHANKIIAKVASEKSEKSSNGNGISRQGIVDELKRNNIPFDSRSSKAELEATLTAGLKK
jgi:hypothetical protein